MKICSGKLTTCGVVEGGEGIRLDFVDDTGAAASLHLPFDQAQSIAMTLPRLLTHAVKSLTGNPQARYVFPLNEWAIESSKDKDGLVLTLATTDGFEVTFGVPAETCRALGWTLGTSCDHVTGAGVSSDEPDAPAAPVLN